MVGSVEVDGSAREQSIWAFARAAHALADADTVVTVEIAVFGALVVQFETFRRSGAVQRVKTQHAFGPEEIESLGRPEDFLERLLKKHRGVG